MAAVAVKFLNLGVPEDDITWVRSAKQDSDYRC